jgi:hypothetical protein
MSATSKARPAAPMNGYSALRRAGPPSRHVVMEAQPKAPVAAMPQDARPSGLQRVSGVF